MPHATLMRLSGIALILGSLGLVAHYLTHPAGESAEYVVMPLWIFSHWIAFPAWMLITLGLVGVYARNSARMGLFGLLAFILAFAAGMLAGPGDFMLGGVVQVLLPHIGNPGELFETAPLARLVFNLAQVWILAYPLFALAMLRAGVAPKAGTWLVLLIVPVAIFALLQLRANPAIAFYAAIAGSAIFALGLSLWGYALVSVEGKVMMAASSAT